MPEERLWRWWWCRVAFEGSNRDRLRGCKRRASGRHGRCRGGAARFGLRLLDFDLSERYRGARVWGQGAPWDPRMRAESPCRRVGDHLRPF